MLEVSETSVDFRQQDKITCVTIKNTSKSEVMFKVKTNNVKAIDAKPSLGSLKPGYTHNITIRAIGNLEPSVKLQITYLSVQNELTKDNFKQMWEKNKSNQKSHVLPVRIISGQKKQESNIHRKSFEKEGGGGGGGGGEGTTQNLFKSLKVDSQLKLSDAQICQQKAKDALVRSQKMENQQLSSNQQLIMENKKLEARIAQINERMNIAKSDRQRVICEKAAGQECQKFHLTPTHGIIIALLFFIMGYFLGNSGPSSAQTVIISSNSSAL